MSEDFLADSSLGDAAEIEIPPFIAGDGAVSYPAGLYMGAIGRIRAVYPKDSDPRITPPEAVTSDLWIIKYLGTVDKPDSQLRIVVKDGKVITMSLRGTKIVERYPHPRIQPRMAWRASGFWSRFDCIEEIPSATGGSPEKVVSWKKAQTKYGILFKFQIQYSKSTKGDGKSYRNIQYDDSLISMAPMSINAGDMKLIEDEYERLKSLEKATTEAGTVSAPPPGVSLDDLPF